ncbi:hypothetical protein KFL_003670040 [Klebsormidium nitens]|uniref:Uncharacterized protein n=1 Tax=Klebsormidium nitens TaxID=105231 RepID=A0A1Y1IAP7_KLENI|nr:hypothetical protein KFL_003670040 [Klebsormidium nitens]|eukprot:GAQ87643.1 hypothetical protein KFL_003670040 [Klebsormidium nitens]
MVNVVFQRERSGAWLQRLQLTDQLLEEAAAANEGGRKRKNPKKSAAESSGRGMQAGKRPRAAPALEGGAPGIAGQATLFISGVLDGACRVLLPAGQDPEGPLLGRLYLTAWDHNRAKPKPLGKPCKEKALLQECWWDSQGRLNCTCHRGRLALDAPCVHKLVLASPCTDFIASSGLPTAKDLSSGAHVVEQLGEDPSGAFYAVRNSPKGVSPEHRMLHRTTAGAWYCEGKLSGCPAQECSHITAAKAALAAGRVQHSEGILLGPDALSTAAHWIEDWEGELPLLGEPGEQRVRGAGCAIERGATGEEAGLLGLIAGQKQGAAECLGINCFCLEHLVLFGEARPASEAGDLDGALETSSTSVEPWKRAPRGSKYWAEHRGELRSAAPRSAAGEPAEDARGEDAIQGWVPACHSCKLSETRQGGCRHAEAGRVQVPVMLLGTEALQITKPKLGKLADALVHHDPWISSLKGGLVRVSKLRDCHFRELSQMGMLRAACPIQPPPCGGKWVEHVKAAVIHASTWSERVLTTIYCCQCTSKAHTVHFCGEHLGLYCWTAGTILVQESLQLILKGMQRSGSAFSAELARDQEAFARSPESVVLSDESWRRASLDFFKLVGRQILECCSICGVHPEVLLADGIVGVANSDGGKRPGGLGNTSLDCRRTFVHPSQHSSGEALEKQSISGRDYCAASLEGGGMKRRLVLQPELRDLLARLSQHRPTSERLGQRLSEAEYPLLKAALAREDVKEVVRFSQVEGEPGRLPILARRRLLDEQVQMVREKNLAVLRLLWGIEADLEARGGSPRIWEHSPGEWGELLYDLGAHDADCGIIGTSGGLSVVRRLLLGYAATAASGPAVRRTPRGGAGRLRRRLLPGLLAPALHHLYILTALARGCTGFGDEHRDGWVIAALRPLNHAVELLRIQAERGALDGQETRLLADARGLADRLLPGVEALRPSPAQWAAMSGVERELLWERLGRDEEGHQMHPLPPGHGFRAELDALGHYALPGWEQKRGLPHYVTFEHANGKSRTGEEFKCNSGQTETEWDAANVPGLTRGGGKGKKAKRPHKSRGAMVVCCPHRVIYGFHVMLRGESPRDVFTVLFTRLNREHLPKFVVYDNACALRNYCMRREPAFFAEITFVVDRFHYAKAGAEVHKCGPSNATDFYDLLRWVNTSAVESVNSFLKRFRTLGWYSGLESFMIFLSILLSGYNVDLRRVDDAKLRVTVPAGQWSEIVRRLLLGG